MSPREWLVDPSRHTGSGLSNARQEGGRRPEDRRHTGSCSCAASGMSRPCACARASYYQRRGWAPFAFACVLLGFAPTSCGIFCPYIHIPGQVSGTEDGVLNMQTAWIRAATTAADKPDRAGRIWHNSDCAANNPSAESLEDGTEEAANQNLKMIVSVQFGRVFLDERVYSSCSSASSGSFSIDDSNFEMSKDTAIQKAFSITNKYTVVNCTLQYLMFAGRRFANKRNQLAKFGKQPLVTVWVGPPSDNREVDDGISYTHSMESSTNVLLAEVNSLPILETCPTMAVEYDTASSGLLQWHPSRGGDRCMLTQLPGTNQPTTFASLPNPLKLTDIAPVRIQPSFCHETDIGGSLPLPSCKKLNEEGHKSCPANERSFLYHVEDSENATLRINGIRIEDKDLWTGYLDLTFSFKFAPNNTLSGSGFDKKNNPFEYNNNEPLKIKPNSGEFTTFCAEPIYDKDKRPSQKSEEKMSDSVKVWDHYCAKSMDDAVSGLVIMNKAMTQFHVLDTTDRTVTDSTIFDKTNCQMAECDSACDAEQEKDENRWGCSKLENVQCMVAGSVAKKVCRNEGGRCKCYSSVVSDTMSEKGQAAYEMILFFALVHRNNQSRVYETGYLKMRYTNDTVLSGTMWNDPQTLEYDIDGNKPFDWFRASPLKLGGRIDQQRGITNGIITFYVDASSKTITTPRFNLIASARYGNVTLPNTLPITPQYRNRTHVRIRGTMNELNAALSVIEYRVPGTVLPHFNTLSKNHSIYGNVSEELLVQIDDGGNSGISTSDGNTTSMTFNLVVVADNDPPDVSGPAGFTVTADENEWFSLKELNVHDVDATDRLQPAETLLSSGQTGIEITELRLQLSCSYGKFRVPLEAMGLHNDTVKLDLITPVPGSIQPLPGESEPCLGECQKTYTVSTYAQFVAISNQTCRDCLENYAKRHVATRGHQVVMLQGDLKACNSALKQSWYKGDPGFGLGTPQNGDAFSLLGKKHVSNFNSPQRAQEYVVVTAMDLGNVGCASSHSKSTKEKFNVSLNRVDDAPSIKFYRNGQDVCEWCKGVGSCNTDCPGGVVKVYPLESTTFDFNETFSPQIRDWDTRDVAFSEAAYQLDLKVRQGVLILPSVLKIGGHQESISGLTFSTGTKGCMSCAEYRVSGKMYELNKVLMGLRYAPLESFNSLFGMQEILQIRVTQLAPNLNAAAVQPVPFNVTMFVQAVNNKPKLNLFGEGRQKSTKLSVKEKFHDFLFLGGSVDRSEHCSRESVSCLTMRDPDACESMYVETGTAPKDSDTLRVQAGTTDICQNTSVKSGKIKMSAKCKYGDLWFFPSAQIKNWPPDASLTPLIDPGKSQRMVTLQQPLSLYLNGVLRYYASPEYSQSDTLTLEVDDGGNTGPVNPGEDNFCCCADSSCSQCSQGDCKYDIDVSACATVKGWTCVDRSRSGSGLPMFAVTIFATLSGVAVGSAVALVVWRGAISNTVNGMFAQAGPRHVSKPVQAAALPTQALSVSQFADNPEAHLVAI